MSSPAATVTAAAQSRPETYRAAARRDEALVADLDPSVMPGSIHLTVGSAPLDHTRLARTVERLAGTSKLTTATR